MICANYDVCKGCVCVGVCVCVRARLVCILCVCALVDGGRKKGGEEGEGRRCGGIEGVGGDGLDGFWFCL